MFESYFQSGQTPFVIFIKYNIQIFFQNYLDIFENFKEKIGVLTRSCHLNMIEKKSYFNCLYEIDY